ncbi:MAG: transaldolase [Roseovarius sp.]
MTTIHRIAEQGQSIWLDFIRRSFLEDGKLNEWMEKGVRGVTSNPSIFQQAIAEHDEYDEQIRARVAEGGDAMAIYEALAIKDIQAAADTLRPFYEATHGVDGYVSLEVSPTLAHDTARTVDDARRLHAAVDRPNLMIKIPATPAGIPAIEQTLAAGINVNVTLIFSLRQYEQTAEAYLKALEHRVAAGQDVRRIASVASFFVSRVDTAVDQALEQVGHTEHQGYAAVDNARLAYARFQDILSGGRWERLTRAGAHVQRPLWASTGTKNPAYADTLYVDSLIGPDTVNTVPPATLEAVLNHGETVVSVDRDLENARARMKTLVDVGVDLETITAKLLDDGVAAFAKAFEGLLQSVTEKAKRLR